jgi:membrane protein YdbS with pleckstrin-like domain
MMRENSHVQEACRWCYEGLWGVLTPYFKLPKKPPQLPSLEGERIEYLHPSVEFLNYRKMEFWILLVVVDVLFIALWSLIAFFSPRIALLITPLMLGLIVLPDIVAYIAIHLNYDTTWYVLSDRSMRIRRGIWTLHETTITFDNIQNIHIQQGPLQRWFGFADLIVQTAGGGSAAAQPGLANAGAHVGVLQGLNNAAEVRERILACCGKLGGSGLGEEAEPNVGFTSKLKTVHAQSPRDLELLREIRDLTARLAKAK